MGELAVDLQEPPEEPPKAQLPQPFGVLIIEGMKDGGDLIHSL